MSADREAIEDLTRGDLARIALAAWVNVRPDQMPDSLDWINHPNDLNRQAWERVAVAIAAALPRSGEQTVSVPEGWVEIFNGLLAAAENMPRRTPGPGGCSTVHAFEIEAGHVWANDRAIIAAQAMLAASPPPDYTAADGVVAPHAPGAG
jgi:hypothetical protein